MVRIVVVLTVISLMINLQNGMASTVTPATAQTQHVIKNSRAHGVKPKTRLKSTLAQIPYNNNEVVVDDDIVFGRNRNRLDIVDEKEEELSDYVKIRLMVARMKAMLKYREING